MGNLTTNDFKAELMFDLRNRSDTLTVEGVTNTRQLMWLNAGYLHVTHPSVFRHRELQHSFTITLVANQQAYVFSPNAGINITAIRYLSHVAAASDLPTAQRVKLRPQDVQWFQERTISSGAPRNYYVRANTLYLNPLPSSAEAGHVLVMGCWKEPALFDAVSAPSAINALFDEIILLAARWRAELHLGYRDMAEATKLDFVGLINEYKSFDDLHGEDMDWSSDVLSESAMESA